MLELAFRSLSWLWALTFLRRRGGANDERRGLSTCSSALDRQLTHVERNLSYYFSPNTHLLGEALALYVCGRALPELSRERAGGRQPAVASSSTRSSRQIGADGGHCERSTHYHRYTLDFYLLALAVARITGRRRGGASSNARPRGSALAARLLADDRGRLPHYRRRRWRDADAACRSRARRSRATASPSPRALVDRPDLAVGPRARRGALAARAPSAASDDRIRSVAAHPSVAGRCPPRCPTRGYYVSRRRAAHHLVIDGGPHGYQNGGHAHADALSLTLTVAGMPLLIDPRHRVLHDRPGAARSHAILRAAQHRRRRRSLPVDSKRTVPLVACARTAQSGAGDANDGFDYFDGAHDGYRPVDHRRHVLAMHGDLLVVADLRRAALASTRRRVHWHIDPRWTVTVDRRSCAVLYARRRACRARGPRRRPLEQFDGRCSNRARVACARLRPPASRRPRFARHTAATAPFWMVSVFGLDAQNAVVDVDIVPVWAEAGTLRQSLGLRIAASVVH